MLPCVIWLISLSIIYCVFFLFIIIYKWMKPIYKGWANPICILKFVVLCSIHLWYATTGAISGMGRKFRRPDAYFSYLCFKVFKSWIRVSTTNVFKKFELKPQGWNLFWWSVDIRMWVLFGKRSLFCVLYYRTNRFFFK